MGKIVFFAVYGNTTGLEKKKHGRCSSMTVSANILLETFLRTDIPHCQNEGWCRR